MPVPETAMDKHDRPPQGKHHVRPSGEVAAMEAISIPHAVNQPADNHLRLRVNGTDKRHSAAAFFW